MELKTVKSSNISAIGHDPSTNTLRVQFSSGTIYEYPDVSAEQHEKLMKAESIGSHFHKNVKSRVEGKKLDQAE